MPDSEQIVTPNQQGRKLVDAILPVFLLILADTSIAFQAGT